jgi:translation initiation factor 3 subunit L
MVCCREIVGEFGVRPLYRMLGYFSIIGLLRVHVLLGDFTLALKVMEGVELNQKVCPAHHLRAFYYMILTSANCRHHLRV